MSWFCPKGVIFIFSATPKRLNNFPQSCCQSVLYLTFQQTYYLHDRSNSSLIYYTILKNLFSQKHLCALLKNKIKIGDFWLQRVLPTIGRVKFSFNVANTFFSEVKFPKCMYCVGRKECQYVNIITVIIIQWNLLYQILKVCLMDRIIARYLRY